MKKIILLDGLEETVITPVFQSVSKDLLRYLKLGDVPIANRENFLLEKNNGPTTLDKNLHNTYLKIDFQIEPISDLGGYRVPLHPDTKSFFTDNDARVNMLTAYRSIKFNLTINVRSKSKSVINNVIELLYTRKLDGDNFEKHNLQIFYTIPNTAKRLMLEIFNIRKKYEPTLTIEKYLKDTLNMNMVDASLALSGDILKDSMVVTEYQTDVIGEYMGMLDDVTMDKEELYYNLPLNYQFTIQRPLSVHLNYPIMIYNENLSEYFRDKHYKHILKSWRNHDKEIYDVLKKHDSFGITNMGYYLKYPRYDEYDIETKIASYTPILTVLCTVNQNNPNELFNIKTDLPGISFKDSILELILLNKDTISEYLGNLFYFVLYRNEKDIMYNEIILDSDGNLTTRTPMDIKNIYRLGIHLCDNVTNLEINVRSTIVKYINKEIVDNVNLKKELASFGIEKQKDSERINNDSKIEVYKHEPLFFDTYLEFFNVTPDAVTDIKNRWTTQSVGEIFFKIKMPDYGLHKLSMSHHTRIFRLFNV